jgi:hypothetical protein
MNDISTLIGSPKQIKWASEIRHQKLLEIRALYSISDLPIEVAGSLHSVVQASWWLNNRDLQAGAIVQMATRPVTSRYDGWTLWCHSCGTVQTIEQARWHSVEWNEGEFDYVCPVCLDEPVGVGVWTLYCEACSTPSLREKVGSVEWSPFRCAHIDELDGDHEDEDEDES